MVDEKLSLVPERASWSKPLEFVLSCLTYAVGLGNIWRFPYLCYQNGGGVFLVIYFLMLFVVGIPIFCLELVIGQYTGVGPERTFSRIAPIMSGLGACTLVVITLVTVYYMVIISWTMFYFFASFTSELQFGSCSNSYNTKGCYSISEDVKCNDTSTFYNFKCTSIEEICSSTNHGGMLDKLHCTGTNNTGPIDLGSVLEDRVLATEEYYWNYMLGRGDATWENFGEFRWQLILCLTLSWIITYFCVLRGVKTSGKAVYFTSIFPYIVLTVLVVLGLTLEGSTEGLRVYITPDWGKFFDVEVWTAAASQTFYSVGIACGSLITLASYNDFHNNVLKDVLIVVGANAFTSLYAGIAIFAMLGHLAWQQGVPVSDVAKEGPGLAFVAYPEAILQLPVSPLWSAIFFLMLFVLGLGSQFAGIEAINTAILDKYPALRAKQTYVMLGICMACFLLAIPMCWGGGIFIFTLLEWNTASWAILLIGVGEVASVAWCYGAPKFIENMQEMKIHFNIVIKWYFIICWTVLTPIALVGVFIFEMVNYELAKIDDYEFPPWASALGILIGCATLVPFPVYAIYVIYTGKYNWANLFRPKASWGPQTSKEEEKPKSLPIEKY